MAFFRNSYLSSAFCAGALLISLTANGALAASAVFSKLSIDEAKSEATKSNKLLLIDFTASWCGPCHRMEKDTWENAEVRKWVEENAIALQLDVDKEKEVSENFKIRAMPSVVIFSGQDSSKESDRHVGYLSASELLKWAKLVKAGGSWIDVLRQDLESVAGKGGREERKARLAFGRALLEKGDYALALNEYSWLWQNSMTEYAEDLRALLMFPGRELYNLAKKSADAKKQIGEWRDKYEQEGKVVPMVVLNEVLSEGKKNIAWFDKVKNDPKQLGDMKKVDYVLVGYLMDDNRWADICFIYPDPMAALKERSLEADKFKEELSKQGIADPPDPLPKEIATLYAALLAAKKDALARKYAAECLKLRNSDLMKKLLVAAALEAKQARKDQRKWAQGDQKLSAKLEEMLKNPKSKK